MNQVTAFMVSMVNTQTKLASTDTCWPSDRSKLKTSPFHRPVVPRVHLSLCSFIRPSICSSQPFNMQFLPLGQIANAEPQFATCAIVRTVHMHRNDTLMQVYDETCPCQLTVSGYNCKTIKPGDIVLFRSAKKSSESPVDLEGEAGGPCNFISLKVNVHHVAACPGLPDQGNKLWSIKSQWILDSHHWGRIEQLQVHLMEKVQRNRLSDAFTNGNSLSQLSFLALVVSSHVVDRSSNLLVCVWDGSESTGSYTPVTLNYDWQGAAGGANSASRGPEKSLAMVKHLLGKWPSSQWWLVIDSPTYGSCFEGCNLLAILNGKVDRMRGTIHIGTNGREGQSVSVIKTGSRVFREFFSHRVTSNPPPDSVGQFFQLAPVDSQVSQLENFDCTQSEDREKNNSNNNDNNNNNSQRSNHCNRLHCAGVQFEVAKAIERKNQEQKEKEEAKNEDDLIRVPGFFAPVKSLSSSSSKLYWVQGQAILVPIDASEIIRVNCYNCTSCHDTLARILSDSEQFTSNLSPNCATSNKGHTKSSLPSSSSSSSSSSSCYSSNLTSSTIGSLGLSKKRTSTIDQTANANKLPPGFKCSLCYSSQGCLFFHIEFTIITFEGKFIPVVLTGLSAVFVLMVNPFQLVDASDRKKHHSAHELVKKKLRQLSTQCSSWCLLKSTSSSCIQLLGERDLVLSISD